MLVPMGIIYVILSILSESTGKTIDKMNFSKNKIMPRQLVLLIFSVMTLVLSILILATNPETPRYTISSILLVSGVILISFVSNMFEFKSLKMINLSLREPVNNFKPVLSGVLAYLVFPEDRNLGIIVAFLLASIVLSWSVYPSMRRYKNRNGLKLVLASVSVKATLPILYGLLLVYFTPEYVTLFRAAGISILVLAFMPRKQLKGLGGIKLKLGLSSGVVYATGTVASLYAIATLGVATTMLLSLAGPAIRYVSARFILKEVVTKRQVLSSLLILLIIGVSTAL